MSVWQLNYPLLQENTLAVAANAKRFCLLKNDDDLEYIAKTVDRSSFLILGAGSNIVFTRDFNGDVIKVALHGSRIVKEDAAAWYVEAAAGELWHDFVVKTLQEKMYGLENLALIPGTVGAAPVQNIGAYGLELKDRFYYLTIYDFHEKKFRQLYLDDCQFAYRHSIFKNSAYSHWLIVAVTFRLEKKWQPILNYAGLTDLHLDEQVTPEAIFEKVVAMRCEKLPHPKQLGNVGSFFKNPIISLDAYQNLRLKAPNINGHPLENNRVKISAAWLIEHCGFKGKVKKKAGVYEKQALVLVNHGGATGHMVMALAEEIRNTVYLRFGLKLEIEPLVV